MKKLNAAMFSSKSQTWGSPPPLFRWLDVAFRFTIDVCASARNAKCKRYWTKRDDALAQDWTDETFYMNPPYDQAAEFTGRALRAALRENAAGAILVPSRTDTEWFNDLVFMGQVTDYVLAGRLREVSYDRAYSVTWYRYEAITIGVHFVPGRLMFEKAPTSAPFPSSVVFLIPTKRLPELRKRRHPLFRPLVDLSLGKWVA